MQPLLVIGASGHAKAVIEAVEGGGVYQVCGLIDSIQDVGAVFFGYPILGNEADLPKLAREYGTNRGFIAIGDNWQRALVARRVRKLLPQFELAVVADPSARVSRRVAIGAGTCLMPGAIINADARIGQCCIVNTRASLDHDSVMEDFASLAPGATVGGKACIGAYSAISLNAGVIEKCRVGTHVVVGAGAIVTQDIADFSVAVGVPAKTIRRRKEGEPYLRRG